VVLEGYRSRFVSHGCAVRFTFHVLRGTLGLRHAAAIRTAHSNPTWEQENKLMAKTAYTIDYAEGVGGDLSNLRAYERKNVLDAIDKQ